MPPIQPKRTKASANKTEGDDTDLFVLEVMLYSNFRRDAATRRKPRALGGQPPDYTMVAGGVPFSRTGTAATSGALIGVVRSFTAPCVRTDLHAPAVADQ